MVLLLFTRWRALLLLKAPLTTSVTQGGVVFLQETIREGMKCLTVSIKLVWNKRQVLSTSPPCKTASGGNEASRASFKETKSAFWYSQMLCFTFEGRGLSTNKEQKKRSNDQIHLAQRQQCKQQRITADRSRVVAAEAVTRVDSETC